MSNMFDRIQELQNTVKNLSTENTQLKESIGNKPDNSKIIILLEQIVNNIECTNIILSNLNVNYTPTNNIEQKINKKVIKETAFKPPIDMDGMNVVNTNNQSTQTTIVDDDITKKLKALEQLK